MQYIKTMLTAFCPSKQKADSHQMDLLRTAPSPLTLPPKSSNVDPPFGSQFWLPIWGHVFMNSICFFFVCVLEPPILGKFWGPFGGLKLGPTWSWRRRQLSTSSIVLAVKTHTHCVVRRSHQLPTAVGAPWGYVDMVLASMRFPALSLGPTKATQRQNLLPHEDACYGVNNPVL